MHQARTRLSRLNSLARPLRPPNGTRQPPKPRLFNNRSPLLLVAAPKARPQLPFLSGRLRTPHRLRLISTEAREAFKYQVKVGLYWSLIGWILFLSSGVLYQLVRQDWLDRLYPSPEDWNWLTKYYWRNTKHEIETEGHGAGVVNWGMVASWYRCAVGLLEEGWKLFDRPEKRDPEITLQQDFDPSIPGIDADEMRTMPDLFDGVQVWENRIGYDVSRKSEEWRRGYFEAMMGMARGSEMRHDHYTHRKTGKCIPPEFVRSPDNPYPKPLPPGLGVNMENPDVEDCFPSIEDPDFHYKRLLTTKGFTRQQRMAAGVAYAAWLDNDGRKDLAEKMYRWSLDLAIQGLANPSEIIDFKTGVIKATAPYVTPNILNVSTALASHYARSEQVSMALNIFLSVLRARRMSPDAPVSRQYPPPEPDLSLKSFDSAMRYITSITVPHKLPSPPPTGDQPFERTRPAECEEAALMAYVGEILFARSGRRREGLEWTREATEIAELRTKDKKLDAKGKKTCAQCIHTGLNNWYKMTKQLASDRDALDEGTAPLSKRSWFGLGGNNEDRALLEEADWRAEERDIGERLSKYERNTLNDQLNAMIRGHSSWFVA